jgi:hypothetical protein
VGGLTLAQEGQRLAQGDPPPGGLVEHVVELVAGAIWAAFAECHFLKMDTYPENGHLPG